MFDQDTVTFLTELKVNNTKEWFAQNKPRYDLNVKKAAAWFCDDIAPRLAARYDTKITSKVFRIHRDLRFSKDKTPYSAHVHISFADAATGAAWMFGLQPDELVVGFGLFAFNKDKLDTWRECVSGTEGDKLQKILSQSEQRGLRVSEPELKRVPKPYSSDHENAVLLRRKGLAIWRDGLDQDTAFGAMGPEKITDALAVFDPLRQWMLQNIPT